MPKYFARTAKESAEKAKVTCMRCQRKALRKPKVSLEAVAPRETAPTLYGWRATVRTTRAGCAEHAAAPVMLMLPPGARDDVSIACMLR